MAQKVSCRLKLPLKAFCFLNFKRRKLLAEVGTKRWNWRRKSILRQFLQRFIFSGGL
jgi:hypothetical protein